MKRITLLVVLVGLGFFRASGQTSGPTIVKQLYLKNQTGFLGSLSAPLPLFTAPHTGLYRANIYSQPSTSQVCSTVCAQAGVVFAPQTSTSVVGVGSGVTQPFPAVAGQSIGYFAEPEGNETETPPYNLYIVIEEL